MIKYFHLSFCLIFFALVSCGQKIKEEKKPEPVVELKFKAATVYSVSCDADKSNTYSLYLPAQYDSLKALPILYLFDPHGKGNLPVENYKSLADEFGLILAGSNNTKNGMDWNAVNSAAILLFNDTKQKLKIDETKIFTCGFSGGCRIASNLALQNKNIAAVISCSAGLPANPSQLRKNLLFIGIAGKEDMNFTEIYDAGEALKNSGIKHLITYFDGPHEWPPVETMGKVFGFCLTPALSKGEGENTVDKKIIEQEKMQKKFYTEAMVKNDLVWWNIEFKNLEEKTGNKKLGEEERYMNIRLKNFLSLAAFSYSGQALNKKSFPEADKFLSIYKLVDPKNAEHAYLRTKYFMLMNNSAEAEKALNEAAELGFSDKERLNNEQLFITLQNSEGYKKIAAN